MNVWAKSSKILPIKVMLSNHLMLRLLEITIMSLKIIPKLNLDFRQL